MGKLIIENRSPLSDSEILPYVASVIELGRISNDGKQYCYGTTFKQPNGIQGRLVIVTDLNEKSDRFVCYIDPPKQDELDL